MNLSLRPCFQSCVLLFALFAGCSGKNAPPEPPKALHVDSSTTTVDVTPQAAGILQNMGLLTPLVPQGFEIAASETGPILAEGDLNGDSLADVAFLLQNLEAEMPHSEALVAYQQQDGSYQSGEKTGNLGPEPLTYLDPEFLQIKDQVLAINYQSMRWGVELKFRREKKYGDLRLIGSESFSYGNAVGDGAGGTSTNFLTGIRIANYQHVDPEKGIEEQLPERRDKVSTVLIPFKGFNDDAIYELQ